MDFHKINYVWQIYPLSKHKKIQIAAILLFHHSNTMGQFVKKSLGDLGRSSCTVNQWLIFFSFLKSKILRKLTSF